MSDASTSAEVKMDDALTAAKQEEEQDDGYILGIDEAGRGPVLGEHLPLVRSLGFSMNWLGLTECVYDICLLRCHGVWYVLLSSKQTEDLERDGVRRSTLPSFLLRVSLSHKLFSFFFYQTPKH